jgi:hypothetical protein
MLREKSAPVPLCTSQNPSHTTLRLNLGCGSKKGSDYINHNEISITIINSAMYTYGHRALKVSSATPNSTQNHFVAPLMHSEPSKQYILCGP